MRKKIGLMFFMLISMILIIGGVIFAADSECANGNHDWGPWKTNGWKSGHTRICSSCKITQSGSHDYGSWKKDNDTYHKQVCRVCNGYNSERHTGGTATCTSLATCSKCGSEYGSTADHVFGTQEVSNTYLASAATCTSPAEYYFKCNNCPERGVYTYSYGPANGHSWGSWSSNGYGTNRQHTRTCTKCGETQSGNHSYGPWYDNGSAGHRQDCTTSGCPSYGSESHSGGTATCQSKATCSSCGATYGSYGSHDWVTDYYDNNAATHYTQRCTICGARQGSESHKTTLSYIQSTARYHINRYTCTLCGNVKDDDFIEHTFGSWSTNGWDKGHSRTCTYCKYVDTESSHDYGSWKKYNDTYHRQVCSVCNGYNSEEHTWGEWKTTKAATCLTTGIQERACSKCEATESKILSATGHTPETNWETNDDQHYKRCTDCNDIVESGNHADNNSDGKCDTCGYIMQRDATITLSPSPTLTLEYGTKDNFTYTYDGDGTLSAISGSTTIARVSLNTSNKTITVTPVKVGETTLTLSAGETNRFFAASATATIKVTYGKITLPSSVSFVYNGKTQNYPSLGDGCTITGETSATNVGTYTVSLSLDSNHEWSDGTRKNKTATWSITQKSINSSDITKTVNPSSYTYDGNAKVPTVTVRDTSRNVNLVAGTDYDITGYGENTKAGNPIITIVGKGNYKDTTTATFEIKPKNLNSSDIVATLSETKYEYDKTAKKPTVTIKDGEKVLTENADYKVTYTNNVEVGTATVTIQGSGNYTGTIIKTFIIEDTTPPTVPVITAKYNSSTGNTYNSGVWTNQNVYISLLSTDLSGIAKYQYQEGGTSGTWRDMPTGGARIWSSTIDKTVYFRAMDKHGNYSGTSNITIRIDKIMPTLGTIKATLRIENGANYTWGTNTDKSIYIKIDNIGSDLGGSGLKETTYKVEKIDPDTNSLIETIKEKETAVTTLVKNGTYRIVVTTEDNAGNRIESQAYIAKIEKYFVNTVKINNIYDIGSGIKEIEIKAVKEGETTPQYENVLKTNEPNINQRIKLTDGTFTITVKIRDKVGNEKTLTQTLTNTVY